jgi:hypothetical protein
MGLRERFRSLDGCLRDLDMPDLLWAAEHRDVSAVAGSRPPQRHRVLFPALIGLLLVVASGIAWAVIQSSATDTVSVECRIDASDTVIPSATGDPVADCAAQWLRDTGHEAPRLVAYDTGLGSITVLPVDEPAPSGWMALPAGTTQNGPIVEMQQWLDDYVSGLNSGCYSDRSATQMTESALQRLGMSDWTVRPVPSSDAGACVDIGILDPGTRTVQLRALGDEPNAASDPVKLADTLRTIARECQTLDIATREVRAAAEDLGLSEAAHQYELTRVADNNASCTRIYEDVGGAIFLILRGPTN